MEPPDDKPYHIEIELTNKSCKIIGMLEDQGIEQFKVEDVRGLDEGSIGHLVRMPSQKINEVSEGPSVKISQINKDETSAWFYSEGCDVCNTIASQGSFLISGRSTEKYKILYSFIAPNYEAFQNILIEFEDKGFDPQILKVEKYQLKGKILTEKQDRVLWHALKMGFFEYPRKINTKELSQKLGIGISTLSEIKRRGMRRILENHFKA